MGALPQAHANSAAHIERRPAARILVAVPRHPVNIGPSISEHKESHRV